MSGLLVKLLRVERYPGYLRKFIWQVWGVFRLRQAGVAAPGRLYLFGMPVVTVAEGSMIMLADEVTLCSTNEHTALGVSRPVILRTLLKGARISVGPQTGLSGTTICAASAVTIGARCLIGADVMIADTDFHPLEVAGRRSRGPESSASAAVIIEDDVFVGARSIILKGVTIGVGSIIGAGSVVTRSIPAGVIAVGNPAKVISTLDGKRIRQDEASPVSGATAVKPD